MSDAAGIVWVIACLAKYMPTDRHWCFGFAAADYQPVSYKIASKRGTRAELKAMTAACKAAGVTVIADVVLNHMVRTTLLTHRSWNTPWLTLRLLHAPQSGATSSSVGFAGSAYSKFAYPAVPYTSANFHSACTPDDSNATSTWDCELSSLSDLATEQAAVRATLHAYLEDLVGLGIGGFRLDSERSIPPADVAAILEGLPADLYIYGEVWADADGELRVYLARRVCHHLKLTRPMPHS